MIEELEERVQQCHNKGVDDNEAIAKANQASKAAKTKKGKTPHRGPAGMLSTLSTLAHLNLFEMSLSHHNHTLAVLGQGE